MFQDGRPKGSAHVDFASKDSATAVLESAAKTPITVIGRRLRLYFSNGNIINKAYAPNEQIFFSGCSGDESEVRALFKQFNDSIVSVFLCMLFTP